MLVYIGIIVLIWSLYLYGTHGYDYWRKKGVKYDKPLPFVGSTSRMFLQKQSLTDYFTELYRRYPEEKFVGFYLANSKALMIRDPELIKNVLITDFNNFYPRGLIAHKTVREPMMKNLFFADGDLWKLLRQRLTPAFTSGKLKAMFPLIVERTQRLQRTAAAAAERGAEVDVRDLMARYTTDFIGACGFGLDTDSISDETSTFRKLGKRIFTFTIRDGLMFFLKEVATEPFKNFEYLAPEIERNTVALVKGIMEQRNYKPSGRNDFIDLLLELKQKGKIVGESIEKRNPDGTPHIVELEMDELLMAAQVFVFFAAGFETSSSATSYTLHQLALHPDQQAKCQQEIDEVLARYDGKLCYDAVKEMQYLHMCFKEGIRLFPSLGFLVRESTDSYQFPGTDVTIEEGVNIAIPLQAIQTDPKYFKDPEKFIPERFDPDNLKEIQKNTYLPFGDGPRACIGERLGLMQSLAGLAAILYKFTVAPSKNTRVKPLVDPAAHIVQSVKGGIPLALTLRS
ncbi:cytochrome P450 6B7-like [Cydia pomonella]|uniref:cytochrome P450 6B7-like n=1 Tax=Cydia pomonella TaxID=82600 RepID=UPI002ADD69D6|nr:cytochrome P450 6B7-like [Cydia pomonella]